MSKQLANEIRQYAKAKNTKIGVVLELLKVNSSQMHKWENGQYAASKETEDRVHEIIGKQNVSLPNSLPEKNVTYSKMQKLQNDIIGDVMRNDSYEVSYKLELIRFILSK